MKTRFNTDAKGNSQMVYSVVPGYWSNFLYMLPMDFKSGPLVLGHYRDYRSCLL